MLHTYSKGECGRKCLSSLSIMHENCLFLFTFHSLYRAHFNSWHNIVWSGCRWIVVDKNSGLSGGGHSIALTHPSRRVFKITSTSLHIGRLLFNSFYEHRSLFHLRWKLIPYLLAYLPFALGQRCKKALE